MRAQKLKLPSTAVIRVAKFYYAGRDISLGLFVI